MCARVRQGGSARRTGEVRHSPTRAVAALKKLRDAYGLNVATFARTLGLPPGTLADWETGDGEPDAASLAKVPKISAVLKGLTRVMRKGFIPTWLENPNDACKEAGAHTPLDLMERGDYAAIEQMIYFLEAGEPF